MDDFILLEHFALNNWLSSYSVHATQKVLTNLKDAEGDIEDLLDDDACKIRIGECFVYVSNEDAEEFAQKKRGKCEKKVEGLEEVRDLFCCFPFSA